MYIPVSETIKDVTLNKTYYLTKDLEKVNEELNSGFLNLYLLDEDIKLEEELKEVLIDLIKLTEVKNICIKLNRVNNKEESEEFEDVANKLKDNLILNKSELFKFAYSKSPLTQALLKTYDLELESEKTNNSIKLKLNLINGKNAEFLKNTDEINKLKKALLNLFESELEFRFKSKLDIQISLDSYIFEDKKDKEVKEIKQVKQLEQLEQSKQIEKLEETNKISESEKIEEKQEEKEDEKEEGKQKEKLKKFDELKEKVNIDNVNTENIKNTGGLFSKLVNDIKKIDENLNNKEQVNAFEKVENTNKCKFNCDFENPNVEKGLEEIDKLKAELKKSFVSGKKLENGEFKNASEVSTEIKEKDKSDSNSKTDKKKNIFGKMPFGKELAITKIIDINDYSGDILVLSEIMEIEEKQIREDLVLFTFSLFDGTSSIMSKKFVKKQEADEVKARIKEHKSNNGIFRIYGNAVYDNFAKEITINILGMHEDGIKTVSKKTDDAEVKRVELRCHTKMSQLDGVIEVKDLYKRIKAYDMKTIAITDVGVVQSFPDAMFASKDNEIKTLYGVDGFLALDDATPITGFKESDIDVEYCVLDIETTGFSFRTDKITEFGMMKIKNGEVIDTFECFVNPEIPIPKEITDVTHITDEMVKDAETIEKVMPKVKEFLGDSILVAHNADFDMGFIKYNAKALGLEINNMYIDTLRLAKQIFPELKRFKLGKIAEHLNIEVIVAHRALDDVKTLVQVFNVMLEKIQEKEIKTWGEFEQNWTLDEEAYKNYPIYNSTILVQKQFGMRNLYELISISLVEHFYRKPRILKSLFEKNREGLIIGSGNSNGELFTAVKAGKSEEELLEIAEFYDYLEVQPPENEMPDIKNGIYSDLKDVEKIIEKIVQIGEKIKKPVVATGDVFFLDPEDKVYREILHVGQKKKDALNGANLYFRTTQEMLEAFEFLGKEKALEIVVTNTNKIADMIDDDIIPISKEKSTPYIDGCEDTIKNMTYDRAHELYGEELPEIVQKRLDKELGSIISNGFSVMYIIAQKLVHKSNEDGYIVGSRGSVGSSLVAFMSGITEVNSLKPHYRCGKCKYSDFSDFGVMNGFDLPDKVCPVCGEKLIKDGMDIPFETFLGFKGNKEPDIDLNFSDEYQSIAHKYTEEIIGDGSTYKAGTIGTIAEKTAFGYVKGYFEDLNKNVSNAEITRLAKGCTGVKRTTGQHPGGIIVVPAGREIYEFCPVQKPADKSDIDIITTHFDYHKIEHNLLKLDILGHLDPTMIRNLYDITGIDPTKVPLDDKDTMSIFSSTKILGVDEKDINSKVGTYGIPEFGTKFVREMLVDTRPTTFEELIRISGLSHGTDVWLNNAQDLVKQKIATLSEAICTRDDIMIYLINKGLESELSFTIMESVRKGKGLKPEWEEEMRKFDVPEWYIKSCKTIKYMFPKAHAAAYVTNAFRVAWFKVHKPTAYYTAYFTVRSGGDFDATFMIYGEEKLKQKMEELEKMPSMGVKEKGVYSVCELVLEMYKRGIKFAPIDLYKSDSKKFIMIDETTILPPLNTIPGLRSNSGRFNS